LIIFNIKNLQISSVNIININVYNLVALLLLLFYYYTDNIERELKGKHFIVVNLYS